MVIPPVDLVVPVKPLHLAKTRLRADLSSNKSGLGGGTGGRFEDGAAHRRLALALVRDTLAAARAAEGVRRVVAICSDPAAVAMLRSDGVEVIPDGPDAGLNPALEHGAELLGADDPGAITGAMQSDLPALRPGELAAALATFHAALAGTGGAAPAVRAFCPDRAGTGTTLLLTAPGVPLDPRFGPGSARAHAASGAFPLGGPWPTLRCDVDTEADLAEATRLGLGPLTAAALAGLRP